MQLQLIQIGFIILTVGSYALLFIEIKKTIALSAWSVSKQKRTFIIFLLALSAWALFVTFWSVMGKMGDFQIFPFNVILVFAIPLIAVLAFTFSKIGTEILLLIPTENIIRLQAFRFFVELLLAGLYILGQAPIQMTFEGRNFDILSGISAPVIAFLVMKRKISKKGLVIWNLLCLGILINIVAAAILSMPAPFRVFMNEPSSIIVTKFPVSLLPGLLVPLAYGLHFLSLRKLLLKQF